MVRFFPALALAALVVHSPLARAVAVDDYPYLKDMVDRLVSEYGLDEQALRETFSKINLRPKVVKAMKRPAERMPWYRYKKLFITEAQIKGGLKFWATHNDALTRAERELGVPREIIVAIIGVETRYGKVLGSHPVLESLTTLTLQYPRRQKFFGEQLEHFLLLTHEQNMDELTVQGSYAGAMGIPQFMPTSYRQYAIDFSGDGKTDLINQTDDAIGSVANYLKRFGWQQGESVTLAPPSGVDLTPFETVERKPTTTVSNLRQQGVDPDPSLAGETPVGVVALDEEENKRIHRITLSNFYVIMRYNPSILYSMAVYELSSALKRRYSGT